MGGSIELQKSTAFTEDVSAVGKPFPGEVLLILSSRVFPIKHLWTANPDRLLSCGSRLILASAIKSPQKGVYVET